MQFLKGKCETICCNDSNLPEQIHLSLPGMGVNAMGVSWVTLDEGPQTLVNYRKTGSSDYATNVGDTTTYKWGSWVGTIHRAMMVKLYTRHMYIHVSCLDIHFNEHRVTS